ncbi:MAG: glutamate--tRNA ligase [Candidatus Latescibacterota bacterium]|nr:MAG: glutamate--tRNA ligase [Candidatus Latescibacterota bacterium]
MAKNGLRVRFAPSPTGYLHVGGARTAIFNWLFARHNRGTFVLRIEDTDVERSTRESENSLVEDLRWLGVDWDEGPDVGGPRGPYRQSDRLEMYRREAETMVEAGVAYPCFCTDDVLEAKRKQAIDSGQSPHYDGTCRSLTPGEVAANRKAEVPEVIRFRVPDGVVGFRDLIRESIELPTDMVGDFVLLRSNGNPTYNFAAALDDHAMGITQVLRGEEHLPNTLRQILIYEALDLPIPQFGHLPLILAEDKSKLSKRHGASSVGELRAMGCLAGAVFNYLVLLGWSHPEEKEILAVGELIEHFTLDRISKSAAVYDRGKLRWMNGQYIRRTPVDELFETADGFFPTEIRETYDTRARRRMLELLHEKIDTLDDLNEKSIPFLNPPRLDDEAKAVLQTREARDVITALETALEQSAGEITAEEFKSAMKRIGKTTGQKGKALFFPIRAALTGSVHGPDLAGVAELKGRKTLLDLLRHARERDSSG